MDSQVIKLLIVCGFTVTIPCAMAQQSSAPVPDKTPIFAAQNSRDLVGKDKVEWLAQMKSRMLILSRQTGPFGMAQDLSVRIAKKKDVKPVSGAFLNMVKAMEINAVIVSEKKFITGSREFSVGDSFSVIRGQRQFNVKVISVKSDSIVFMDANSNEYIRKNLNALPSGMSRKSSMDVIEGITPEHKKDSSPLHLDSTTLPTSTTQGRN